MFLTFGKAPFVLFCVAILSGLGVLLLTPGGNQRRPDLIFALFSKEHKQAYERVIPEFERTHGVTVQLQLIDAHTLQTRLQAAMQAGAEVPDVVEIVEPSLGFFSRGPLADIGFVDLTQRVNEAGLRQRMVASRFGLWTSREHVFAIPHDVHPVMLAYRRDLFEKLDLHPEQMTTWNDFLAVGHKLVAMRGEDGFPRHYLIDLPSDGGGFFITLLWQAGGGLFDAQGQVRFDDDIAKRVALWFVQASRGPQKISTPCGWGQNLARCVVEERALCFITPDWRTKQFELDMPDSAGKFALMPLPAWDADGRRTSVMGGTGIAITKSSKKQDLAWEFIQELYLRDAAYGARYQATNILPPMRSAWNLPELNRPNAFFSNQPIGALYAALAPSVPEIYVTSYDDLARSKITEAVVNIGLQYEAHGDNGLDAFATTELQRCANYVRTSMARNHFINEKQQP